MIKSYSILLIILIILTFSSCSDDAMTLGSVCMSNPCAESKIPHKIICEEREDNDFICVCELGYELKDNYCVKISNNTPCDNNPCTEQNRGICTVSGNNYECNCDLGFYLEDNRCIEVVGTPCEDYICSDDFSSCQVIDNEAKCICYNGYEQTNNSCIFHCEQGYVVNEANDGCVPICDIGYVLNESKDWCMFDCSDFEGSVVNDDNDACICEMGFHIEDNKCINNTKGVNCKTNNPNKPQNSKEIIEEVEVEWNEESQTWEEASYCDWNCLDLYTSDNCDVCVQDYLMNEGTCVYDCSNDENSVPNNTNDSCVCMDEYHLGSYGFCVETVNPCEANPCLENLETNNRTNCTANSQELGDYTCECQTGFGQDDNGICVELSEFHIRAVTGNISSGNGQDYDLGHGIRIFQGLKANVMMVQEFNYLDNTDTDYKEMVEAVFQDPGCLTDTPKRCYYEVGTGSVIPNGVMSRFPIIEWGEWADPNSGVDSTRHLNWARLDIPGEKDLWVISVHLSTDESKRRSGARAIIDGMIEKEIPSDAYVVLGGDFNTKDREEEVLITLAQRFYTVGPHPISEDGLDGTDAGRDDPYDWVLVSPSLRAFQSSTAYCSANNTNDCKTYDNGLVMDTREYTQDELDTYFSPTSFDEWTLQVNDSDAGSMQHQAVVKDFIISF